MGHTVIFTYTHSGGGAQQKYCYEAGEFTIISGMEHIKLLTTSADKIFSQIQKDIDSPNIEKNYQQYVLPIGVAIEGGEYFEDYKRIFYNPKFVLIIDDHSIVTLLGKKSSHAGKISFT